MHAATQVRRFGVEPKIALVSRSDFGSYDCDSGRKLRAALDIILAKAPELEVDGDMNGESALVPAFRQRIYPHSRLNGEANVLIMPNIDAANAAYQMIKFFGDALPVGPILIGAAQPAHILTPSTTARGVVNMTAFAAVDAQQRQEQMLLGLQAR
jgi:malate dehydrogenase (oxaloacetate-decarboxylating)(NADP+)